MDWFSTKQTSSFPRKADRYAGKPLLMLLEWYVLDCIGYLPADKVPTIIGAVQRVFAGGTDWKQTLRCRLYLEPELDDSLRQMWTKNQAIATAAGQTLLPYDFAQMVADQNFSPLIDSIETR